MKADTDLLVGAALNRAVAMSLGCPVYTGKQANDKMWGSDAPAPEHDWLMLVQDGGNAAFCPVPDYVNDIGAAWPLIEDLDIDLYNTHSAFLGFKATLSLQPYQEHLYIVAYGATRLEAAMRAVVKAKFGEHVDLEEP